MQKTLAKVSPYTIIFVLPRSATLKTPMLSMQPPIAKSLNLVSGLSVGKGSLN